MGLSSRVVTASAVVLVACGSSGEPPSNRPTGPAYSEPSAPGDVTPGGGSSVGGATSGVGGASAGGSTIPSGVVCDIDGCQAAAGAAGAASGGGAGSAQAGTAGKAQAGGSAGKAQAGGSAGKAQAGGSAGKAQAGGSAGSVQAGGSAGSVQTGGSAGSVQAGGSAGSAGSVQTGGSAGSAGSVQAGGSAGSAGSVQAGGSAGSAQTGGSAGGPQAGAAGAAQGGAVGGTYPAPVAYWPLDDVFGVATAEAATARGAMEGKVSSVPGLSGRAMHIEELGDDMWVPPGAWTQPLTALTISLWIKPDQDWTSPFGHYLVRTSGLQLTRDSTWVRFQIGSDTAAVQHSLIAGRWYHIVGTYSSGSELSVSVEDALTPGASAASVQPGSATVPGSAVLTVLRMAGSVPGGAIDDLAIFDHALTASDRAQLYALGASGQSPVCPSCTPKLEPMHAWRFDEPSYGRATPEIAQGIPTMTVGLSSQQPGKVGDALFAPEVLATIASGQGQPGSGAEVPPHAALQAPSFTLAAWVRPDRTLTSPDINMGWFDVDAINPPRGLWFGYSGGITLKLGPGTPGLMSVHKEGVQLDGGKWTHVAATFDGTTSKIYVDGAPVGEQQHSITYTAYDGTLRLCGNAPYPAGLPLFPGGCDEMAFFDSALDASQIAALYARGVAGQSLWKPVE